MAGVGEVRRRVVARDGECMAPKLDPDAGACYDRWGRQLHGYGVATKGVLEMDYVRLGHHGPHHAYASDHVLLCAGHHRGAGPHAGHQWATSHRALLRQYLDRISEPQGPPGACQACQAPVLWHRWNGWCDPDTWEPHEHG